MTAAQHWLPGAVYLLCFLTSAACAWLLTRSYLRTRTAMLMWSALCFALLALNNLIVIFDVLVVRKADLSTYRLGTSLLAVGVLLFGFIWSEDDA
jgi:Family of unknown function (DUF5985)